MSNRNDDRKPDDPRGQQLLPMLAVELVLIVDGMIGAMAKAGLQTRPELLRLSLGRYR